MIYIFILLVLLFCACSYDGKQNAHRTQYWFLCVVLVLFIGLRYKVGGDSLSYITSFDDTPLLKQLKKSDLFETRYPPLWVLLNSFCKTFFKDFVSLQLAQSLFVNVVLFAFFQKYTKFKFRIVLFYYFFYFLMFNTETMRAACSLAFLLISFRFYNKNKWIKYYLFTLIAIGFHYQAIILLFLPLAKLLNNLNYGIKSITIVALVSFSLALSGDIVPAFADFFTQFTFLYESVSLYTSNVGKNNLNGYIAFVLNNLLYMYLIWVSRKNESKDILSMAMLFVVFSFLSLSFGIIMSRTRDLFSPFILVIMVNSFSNLKGKDNLFIRLGLIISLFTLVMIKTNYYTKDDRYKLWHPYSSVLDPQESVGRESLYEDFLKGYRK